MTMDKELEIEIETGIWNGLTQYKCPYCQYDDLNLDRLNSHIQKAHTVPVQPRTPGVITDVHGNRYNK